MSSEGRQTSRAGIPGLWTTVVVAVLLLGGGIAASVGDDGDDEASSRHESTTTTAGSDPEADADAMASEAEAQVEAHEYVTRRDLRPPVIDVTVSEASDAGLVFLAPKGGAAQKGALIVDGTGEPVWVQPSAPGITVADFRVQTYQGQPVLTWWEGTSADGYGVGDFVIADAGYNEIRRFPAGNGRPGDIHELQLTDRGTALVIAYQTAPADLSSVGGPVDGYLLDNYVQEVDVATGQVLFEWNARDHVPLTDTYHEMVENPDPEDVGQDDGSQAAPFDYVHLNSVAEDGDALLVSARNTKAVYAIDRSTGELRWTLGGKRSDFTLGEGADFHWQHDARRLPDGTLSLFDNEAAPATADRSRGLVLRLDEAARTATLVREWVRPAPVLAGSQGNMQVLADGAAVVGWGSAGGVTHFAADGRPLLDASWAPADSYRVYRQPWVGRPTSVPDVVATPAADAAMVDVHVSWNGATEVTQWQILGGGDPAALAPITTVARDGFETQATITLVGYVAVQALDASGAVLATSAPVPVAAG